MRGGSFGFAAALESVLQAAHHNIESGRENQPENGDAQHAEQHGGAERLPEFSAGADRDHKRQHTEDEGERSHQDRAQTKLGRFRRGLIAIPALVFELLGEFHDQDCVFGGKADQHDEPDLRQDVVVHAAQDNAGDGGDQAHRYDQDDGERQRQAFILRRQHQEHEHHRQREGEHRGVASLDLLIRQRRPFIGEAVGQRFGR